MILGAIRSSPPPIALASATLTDRSGSKCSHGWKFVAPTLSFVSAPFPRSKHLPAHSIDDFRIAESARPRPIIPLPLVMFLLSNVIRLVYH